MLAKWAKNTKRSFFLFGFAIWILIVGGWVGAVHAQSVLKYWINGTKPVSGIEPINDPLEQESFAEKLLESVRREGYPLAFVHQKTYHGDTLFLYLERGDLHTWVSLDVGNLDEKLAHAIGYQPAEFQDKPFDFEELNLFFDRVLKEAQNTGRPFASIRLDGIEQEGNKISAALDYNPGPLITFDTVQITGNSKTKGLYLNRLLKIMPGTPFSQKQVDRCAAILKNLPFVQLSSSPQLSFQNLEATLHLPLDDRRINALDGIIGLLPNEAGDNKLLVTGRFDLALFNVGGWGRNYSLNWQRLNKHSQSLNITAREPMLLGSWLDLGLTYALLKEDTSFLNRDLRVELGYRTGPTTYLSFFSRRQSGDLLTVSQGVNTTKLPEIADFKFSNYGFSMLFSSLDDGIWPRRGWLGNVEFGMGNKRLLRNIHLPDIVYQNAQLKSFQYYLSLITERHIYVKQHIGAFVRGSVGEVGNENLLLNDLYRLGGLKSIRGFNENFFFANRYVYVNFEPRYYFNDYSYFLLFLDMGRIWNEVGTRTGDWPRSLGMGARLDTEGGVFNFIIAWGQSNEQAVGLKTPNIHFGYTGKF